MRRAYQPMLATTESPEFNPAMARILQNSNQVHFPLTLKIDIILVAMVEDQLSQIEEAIELKRRRKCV